MRFCPGRPLNNRGRGQALISRFSLVCVLAVAFGATMSFDVCAQSKPDGGHGNAQASKPTPPPKSRMTPLQRLMKDGVPANSTERARLRDNLYALLATAAEKKAAKKITSALQRVWLTSGSDTVDLLMLRAIKAQKGKKPAVSLKLFDAVVDLAPDYAEGWNRRAYLYYKQRNYHAAAGDLRRTLALDPKHYRALSGLGTILTESGDEAGALKVYERLIDVNPNAPGAQSTYKELKRKVEGRGI